MAEDAGTCTRCGINHGYIAGMCGECMDATYPGPPGHSHVEVLARFRAIRKAMPATLPSNILDLKNPRKIIEAVAFGTRRLTVMHSGQAAPLGRMMSACCLCPAVPPSTVDALELRYPFFAHVLRTAQARFHTTPRQPGLFADQ